jgi:cell division protein FtsN
VSISTPGGPGHAPDASDLAQHTLFYNNGGAVLSPRDTGGRPARSSTQGGSTSTATVRVRAAGDVAAGAGTTTAGTTTAGTTTAGSSKKRTASSRSRVWTVQVASYETLDEAMAMQANLCSRGYEARIRGAVRPFEVRVGRYASSDSALRIARRLTTRQLTVFVTPAE